VSQLKSNLSPNTPAFKSNAAAMAALVDELRARQATASLGGDERSRKRHTERGKLLPRERVEGL
jgi:3-methylcrotonyl-CoA carboxylase beta subunit